MTDEERRKRSIDERNEWIVAQRVECPRCGAPAGQLCGRDSVCRLRVTAAKAEQKSERARAETKKGRKQTPAPEGWSDKRVIRIWRSALKRGKAWTIPHDLAVAYLTEPCWYCGATSTGLDRIDSDDGYHPGNVAPCCRACNAAKWTYSIEEWRDQMAARLAHIGAMLLACTIAASCGDIEPLPIPSSVSLDPGGLACASDADCLHIDGAVCYVQPDDARTCRVPCYAVEDCPNGFDRCGELVGERSGRRVCL